MPKHQPPAIGVVSPTARALLEIPPHFTETPIRQALADTLATYRHG
ncbi:MAG TPA: hypothetical protein VGD53_27975 [Actinoallomurus sp.]|jgi:hypothetical protein